MVAGRGPSVAARAASPDVTPRRHLGGGFFLLPLPSHSPYRWRIDTPFRPPEWAVRRPATPTRPLFPGSGVLIDGGWHEIVREEPGRRAAVAASFFLTAWEDRFPLRRVFELTPDACRKATRHYYAERRREHLAALLRPLTPLVGLLPAVDQQRVERLYGVPAGRASFLSALCLLPLSVALTLMSFAVMRGMHFGAFHPVAAALARYALVYAYFAVESLIRLAGSGYTGEPLGSLPVWLPLTLFRAVRQALSRPSRRAAAERLRQRRSDRYLAARDEVRRTADGIEILSLLPKDHWTAGQTAVEVDGELYTLDERQVVTTPEGERHRFVLKRPEHEVLFREHTVYRPEEVRDVYRAMRRRAAAMWVESFPFLWGLLDEPTQRRLAAAYRYAPERFTRWTIWGLGTVGAIQAVDRAAALATGGGGAAAALGLLAGLYLVGEAAWRWTGYRRGELRGSLLGRPLRRLVARPLRWE